MPAWWNLMIMAERYASLVDTYCCLVIYYCHVIAYGFLAEAKPHAISSWRPELKNKNRESFTVSPGFLLAKYLINRIIRVYRQSVLELYQALPDICQAFDRPLKLTAKAYITDILVNDKLSAKRLPALLF